ncbi:MAG: sigma factor [Candidatus Limnocylindrales bacterium]
MGASPLPQRPNDRDAAPSSSSPQSLDRGGSACLPSVVSGWSGDEIAFGRLFATYHDDVCRVCVHIPRDEQLSEDAVQTAWSIAWRKRESPRASRARRTRPPGWVGTARIGPFDWPSPPGGR